MKQETTRANLADRFDAGESVIDYFTVERAKVERPARSPKGGKGQARAVYRREDGTWANKRVDSDRASSVHDTQRAAEKAARDLLLRQGGGELITMSRDGHIRSVATIAPGNDPPQN